MGLIWTIYYFAVNCTLFTRQRRLLLAFSACGVLILVPGCVWEFAGMFMFIIYVNVCLSVLPEYALCTMWMCVLAFLFRVVSVLGWGTHSVRQRWILLTNSLLPKPARRSNRCWEVQWEGVFENINSHRKVESKAFWTHGYLCVCVCVFLHTDASAAMQVRALKDYCNNYDLTSLNIKAGDIITVKKQLFYCNNIESCAFFEA